MLKDITFTPIARKQLDKTLEYIQLEFGNKSTTKFLETLERQLDRIAEGFIKHRYFNTQRKIQYFILLKKSYILYKETLSTIQVVGIYSVKQNILSKKE